MLTSSHLHNTLLSTPHTATLQHCNTATLLTAHMLTSSHLHNTVATGNYQLATGNWQIGTQMLTSSFFTVAQHCNSVHTTTLLTVAQHSVVNWRWNEGDVDCIISQNLFHTNVTSSKSNADLSYLCDLLHKMQRTSHYKECQFNN